MSSNVFGSDAAVEITASATQTHQAENCLNGKTIENGTARSAEGEQEPRPVKLATSLSPPPTDKDTERGAVHREQEHNAKVAATPEGSISPETPRGTSEYDIEEATLRRNGDGLSASRLTALLSELQRLRCSPADQDSGDSDGPFYTCESTDSMPSSATSLSEYDALYFAFEDMANAIPATTGMVLINGQSR
ncbi:hypothetical protein BBAD15_g2650 [Beauveria bassiana D1-5]|uniref:Uncharacterized protein n=1 Tax=Beauveria bassiana D1-5 TaxID=1245745 RepID=A0A0A2WEM2_BEABA|nr:hypothetical protein BBAD15_g2650 [Beauveria bassiana D1-5]